MAREHSAAAEVYVSACRREHAQISDALVQALDKDAKAAVLGQGSIPLNDIDICCVAEVIRSLGEDSQLRVLVLEENSFGLPGVTALMEAIEANPNRIRELRLGKNNLKDQAAVVIGHTLSRNGCGLKVLDLSENSITKLGVIPIAAALQQPFCDIVELSFHNNKIEGDAASYLGQALRTAPKLKHLHLGYNTLRDNGAAQIARSVPHAACLSTLDLTANRISREGGEELVRALMSPTCTVQRLNLRHNQLDSETIELFADVIAHNTSLIQLFLGFMNPSPEAAATVLSAIPQNHTLLLLDIYGWKLIPKSTLALIQAVQQKNSTIAALVTDACQSIATQVDEGNVVREEERDLHPIYVGPDDRDAYLATKSLRRYSRAQSRRQSRTASRVQSRARPEGQPASRTASSHRRSERGGSHPASRSSRAVSPAEHTAAHEEAPQSQRSSSRHSRHRSDSAHGRRHRHRRSGDDGDTAPSGSARSRTPRSVPASARSTSRSPRAEAGQLVPVETRQEEDPVKSLLGELHDTPCDPHTTHVLKSIIAALQSSAKQQQAQIRSLTARVEALETRRECFCGVKTTTSPPRSGSPSNAAQATGSPARSGISATAVNGSAYQRMTSKAGSIGKGATAFGTDGDDSFTRHTSQHQQHVQSNSAVHSFQRSMSRMSQNTSTTAMERCTTPHVTQDAPPDIAHPNDESGEHHPEGVELQRSASIQNFPPRIEPSPAQDANPPRRKSVSHAF
ncbi:Leucine Rich repeat [Novymonas esmeraldas]|uniref:Leucine Rich repeat n=1 Tax=Novymonas esmeraldas TaxID=1808958 RepID=A0AAW0EYI2_9TRYP